MLDFIFDARQALIVLLKQILKEVPTINHCLSHQRSTRAALVTVKSLNVITRIYEKDVKDAS